MAAEEATARRERARREMVQNTVASSVTIAGCVAAMNPLDTLRLRWQLHPVGAAAATLPAEAGISAYTRHVVRTEGLLRGLWAPGIGSNMVASALGRGLGLGAYPLVRDSLDVAATALGAGDTQKSVLTMYVAGMLAGCVAYGLANPCYQMKTRLQACAGAVGPSGVFESGAMKGQRPPYRHMVDGMRRIAVEEGVLSGLYRGVGAIMLRGALMNGETPLPPWLPRRLLTPGPAGGAAMGYDATKTQAKRREWLDDGPLLHVVASIVSALAQTACLPADVLMTRYQSAAQLPDGPQYRGLLHCAVTIRREEGASVFFRGWTPMFARVAPLAVVFFPVYEQIRRLVGLGFMD